MTPTDDTERSPFEILGVDYEADDREVRRAYAAKIREARRGGDPEVIRAVQNAFEEIRDSDARSQARKMWENRSSVEPLLVQAEAYRESGQTEEALGALLEALRLVPDAPGILGRVASLELSLLRVDDAVRHVVRLVRLDPHQGSSCAFLAHALATRARVEPDPEEAGRFWNQALSAVRRARNLGAVSTSVVLLESQILWNRSDWEDARRIVHDALEGCRDLRSPELQLFVALLRMDALRGNTQGVNETLGRVRALLPQDEARRTSVVRTLCEFAMDVKLLRPKDAIACLELARECYPDHPWVLEEIRRCRHLDRSRQIRSAAAAARSANVPGRSPRPLSTARVYSTPSSKGWTGSVVALTVALVLVRVVHHLVTHDPSPRDRSRSSFSSRPYESRSPARTPQWNPYDPTNPSFGRRLNSPGSSIQPGRVQPGRVQPGKVELPYGVQGGPKLWPEDPRSIVPSTPRQPSAWSPRSSPSPRASPYSGSSRSPGSSWSPGSRREVPGRTRGTTGGSSWPSGAGRSRFP